jgi:hypothetical protein
VPAVGFQARGVVADPPSIGTAVVKPIPLSEAKRIIEKYEYLGTMPAVARHAFGIFFGEKLGGAVVYGDEYTENRGVWDRFGFGGKIIALLRGVCLPWAHPHSASKLIRRSMAMLPERFQVVTATCCKAAGEIGTIYQAAGFDYAGQMYRGTRALIYHAGKIISERQAKRKFGTCGRRALAKLGIRSHLVPRRSRYFAFRGDRREQVALRAAIADRLRPYPKRHDRFLSSTTAPVPPVAPRIRYDRPMTICAKRCSLVTLDDRDEVMRGAAAGDRDMRLIKALIDNWGLDIDGHPSNKSRPCLICGTALSLASLRPDGFMVVLPAAGDHDQAMISGICPCCCDLPDLWERAQQHMRDGLPGLRMLADMGRA